MQWRIVGKGMSEYAARGLAQEPPEVQRRVVDELEAEGGVGEATHKRVKELAADSQAENDLEPELTKPEPPATDPSPTAGPEDTLDAILRMILQAKDLLDEVQLSAADTRLGLLGRHLQDLLDMLGEE